MTKRIVLNLSEEYANKLEAFIGTFVSQVNNKEDKKVLDKTVIRIRKSLGLIPEKVIV